MKKISNLFGITNVSANWLCKEDKELYWKQVESRGRVGYMTKKLKEQLIFQNEQGNQAIQQPKDKTSQMIVLEKIKAVLLTLIQKSTIPQNWHLSWYQNWMCQ